MLILLIVLLTLINIALRVAMAGVEVAWTVYDRADKFRKRMEKTAVVAIRAKGHKKTALAANVSRLGVDTALAGVKLVGKAAKKLTLLALKTTLKLVRKVISLIRSALVALSTVVLVFDVLLFIILLAATAGFLVLYCGTDENGRLVLSADVVATIDSPTSSQNNISGNNSSSSGPVFTKYDLTDDEILQLASLCRQEQGTVAGAAAEASLMCNLYESSRGDDYSSLYDYVRNGGWFAHAAEHMDDREASDEIVNVVDHVIRGGFRVLPGYIDEHDYFGDITSATNDGVAINENDRGAYKKNVTIIKNRYGSTYTFYCFPDETSDPFGYTSEELRAEMGDDCYTLEDAIAGTYSGSSEGNGEFLLTCDNIDSSYQGTTWTVDDRDLLESLISSEFGDDYKGSVLVAQAVRDSMVDSNTHSVSQIIEDFGYTGLEENPTETTTNAVNAVTFVFDEGGSGVQHRIKAMYNTLAGTSSWHESLEFVIQYKNVRFFDYD